MTAISFYYLVWLLGGLAVIAGASAFLARRLCDRAVRRACARPLVEALSRYAAWLAAQRGELDIEIAHEVADAALQEARGLQLGCFPELASWMEALLATHRRLQAWALRQAFLRHRHPEAWLDLQGDPTRLQLLHRQDEALGAMTRQLPAPLRRCFVQGAGP